MKFKGEPSVHYHTKTPAVYIKCTAGCILLTSRESNALSILCISSTWYDVISSHLLGGYTAVVVVPRSQGL